MEDRSEHSNMKNHQKKVPLQIELMAFLMNLAKDGGYEGNASPSGGEFTLDYASVL